MLMLGIDPVVVALVAAAFIGGMGIEVFSLGWNLAMQENVDDDMLSRASSYDMLGSFIAMPIGQLAWGPLGALFGNERVLVASGVAYAVICGLVLCSRSVRTLPRAAVGTGRGQPTVPLTLAVPFVPAGVRSVATATTPEPGSKVPVDDEGVPPGHADRHARRLVRRRRRRCCAAGTPRCRATSGARPA